MNASGEQTKATPINLLQQHGVKFAFVLLAVLFVLVPEIDMAIASYFYYGDDGFKYSDQPIIVLAIVAHHYDRKYR